MISIGVGLLVIVVFYSFAAVSSALGKGGVLPPFIAAWLVWLAPRPLTRPGGSAMGGH